MSKELLLVAKALSNEKDISEARVFQAIQEALETATRKLANKDINVRVQLNSRTGEYITYRRWLIVSDENYDVTKRKFKQTKVYEYTPYAYHINPLDRELSLSLAKAKFQSPIVGEYVEEIMESISFGRIAAQSARHVILQKIREAEREQIIEQFKCKLHQLIYGTVKKVTKDSIIIDVGGKVEAFLPRSEILPNEMFRVNDRVRAYLYDINVYARGPQLLVSRTKNEMLIELFKIEVPEIGESTIEIKAAAREPGNRAKIAVKTNDGRIDAVGACVGMRGARVQAISNELGGEKVDIVLWDDNEAQLVINAMSPVEIVSIIVDEDNHTMDLAVAKEHLSQAIGRNGQNVKLATELTGWTLNVMNVEEFEAKNQEESKKFTDLFVENLKIDPEIATILVQYGFSSVEEISYVSLEELSAIVEFDEEIIKEIRSRANNFLLMQALSPTSSSAEEDLLSMEGMTLELIKLLKAKGINSIEELAEQAVDDLTGIPGMSEEKAGRLIMKAREPWFQ